MQRTFVTLLLDYCLDLKSPSPPGRMSRLLACLSFASVAPPPPHLPPLLPPSAATMATRAPQGSRPRRSRARPWRSSQRACPWGPLPETPHTLAQMHCAYPVVCGWVHAALGVSCVCARAMGRERWVGSEGSMDGRIKGWRGWKGAKNAEERAMDSREQYRSSAQSA